jgi:hypothetical protein
LLAIWRLGFGRSIQSLLEGYQKNWMLSLYDTIACAWWQGKGRTSTAGDAPNVFEYFGSVDAGEFMRRIINVYSASFTLQAR